MTHRTRQLAKTHVAEAQKAAASAAPVSALPTILRRGRRRFSSSLSAQLKRPGIGYPHFRGSIALDGYQGVSKGDLQREFLLGALR